MSILLVCGFAGRTTFAAHVEIMLAVSICLHHLVNRGMICLMKKGELHSELLMRAE